MAQQIGIRTAFSVISQTPQSKNAVSAIRDITQSVICFCTDWISRESSIELHSLEKQNNGLVLCHEIKPIEVC